MVLQKPKRSETLKVGIIGYNGFVGSAFFEVFSQDKKCQVTGIEKENKEDAKKTEYDILINANGNSSKRLADQDPLKDFEMNVISTLDFVRNFRYKNYMHISTVEVYEDKSSQAATKEDAKIDTMRLSNYGFSKYIGELVAKKYAKSWMILRLAGMVGKNMKKGPAYDMLNSATLFVSEKSRLHYMNTKEVASIAKALSERKKWGHTYNIVGEGNIELAEFAKIAGASLQKTGTEVHLFDVSVDKLKKEIEVPKTIDTVREFVKSWKA